MQQPQDIPMKMFAIETINLSRYTVQCRTRSPIGTFVNLFFMSHKERLTFIHMYEICILFRSQTVQRLRSRYS